MKKTSAQYHHGRRTTSILSACVICLVALCIVPHDIAVANDAPTNVPASHVYTLDDDSKYDIADAPSSDSDANGTLQIAEQVDEGKQDGIPAYQTDSDTLHFSYVIDKDLEKRGAREWHLADDNGKTVNGHKLDDKVRSGAILIQTSLDGTTWIDETAFPDAFAGKTARSFYEANAVQLQNGCYLRIQVAYRMERQVKDSKILFITKHNYERRKVVEEYVFYVHGESDGISPEDTPKQQLGQKINTGKDNGYSGNKGIDVDDPHYGWDIGYFFVNGYTREETEDDGTPVFLKNVNDQVTLWFHLSEDISALNGDDALTINEDTNGYDKAFEVDKTNFKHGALIIQSVNSKGEASEPIIYTDYLAASARTGADTKVQLFEEGDYIVSLDYEIKSKGGIFNAIPSFHNYKIMFEFSIRNGNSMIFPFDIDTGRELSDNGLSEHGFTLDLANSQYLTVDVERSVLSRADDGTFTADVRSNRPASDGDTFTDEGIYTIRAANQYTGEDTTKTIYVGSDPYLRALSDTGISIMELNRRIKAGTITFDESEGNTDLGSSADDDAETRQQSESAQAQAQAEGAQTRNDETIATPGNREAEKNNHARSYTPAIVAAGIVLVAVIAAFSVLVARKRSGSRQQPRGGRRA